MLDKEEYNKLNCIYKLKSGICCLLSSCKCDTTNKDCYLYNLIKEDDFNPYRWIGE